MMYHDERAKKLTKALRRAGRAARALKRARDGAAPAAPTNPPRSGATRERATTAYEERSRP